MIKIIFILIYVIVLLVYIYGRIMIVKLRNDISYFNYLKESLNELASKYELTEEDEELYVQILEELNEAIEYVQSELSKFI